MGTYLARSVDQLRNRYTGWHDLDRLIVITDEQSHDGIALPWIKKSYVINVAPYKNGVSYRNGWYHIDGWSEAVLDYIREYENFEHEIETEQ